MKNPVLTWCVSLTAGFLLGGFLLDGMGVVFGVLIGESIAFWITRR